MLTGLLCKKCKEPIRVEMGEFKMIENDSHLRRAKHVMAELLRYHAERSEARSIPVYPLTGDDILIAAEFMGYGIEDLEKDAAVIHKDEQAAAKEWTGQTLISGHR